MNRTDEAYHKAHAEAQALADRYGRDYGIERMKEFGRTVFNVRMLPGPQFRFGADLRCEIVSPMRPARD